MLGYYDIENASYKLDYRVFLGSNKVYNKELSKASLIFANAIYNGKGFDYKTTGEITDIEMFLKHHGLKNVKTIKLATQYDDDDISEVCIGYHDVKHNSQSVRVISVVIRGTNGTIEEWSSNFDLGNPTSSTPWTSDYHKGFYITEERIKACVEDYVDELEETSNIVYWITGHSRGAALANILAARMIDDGNKVFAYTFATPSTTISNTKNDSKYNSIFNFANTSDVISYVPLKEWDFGRFGITKEVSIEDSSLEGVWCEQTKESAYNALNKKLISQVVNRIYKSCSKTWSEVFEKSGKHVIDMEQFNNIPLRAFKYCNVYDHESIFSDKVKFDLYPSLAFVFQLVAEALGGEETLSNGSTQERSAEEKSKALAILPELWNSKYFGAILLLLPDAWDGKDTIMKNLKNMNSPMELVGDGHATATYFVIIANEGVHSGGGRSW